ncbi:hypothetical protein B7494_g832 [Chlorociboria aeruginascens]|nr:hypothetical protein B7494_g832 [Chlorociboria aeruginascens]
MRPDLKLFNYYMSFVEEDNGFSTTIMEQNLINYVHRQDGPMTWKKLDENWDTSCPDETDVEKGWKLKCTCSSLFENEERELGTFGLSLEFMVPNASGAILSPFEIESNHTPKFLSTVTVAAKGNASATRNLVLYGLEATGKSAITKFLLEALSSSNTINEASEPGIETRLRYAIIKSRECISGRHLLEATLGAVAKATEWEGNIPRCENLAQLVVEVRRILEGWRPLDRDEVKKQRFVLIPNLTSVFITTSPRPNFLHCPGAPHIQFPAYTKPELLQILSQTDPKPPLPNGLKETKDVWTRFCSAIWDTLAKHSGRDIISFRATSLRLWPSFIAPILNGTYTCHQFSRLLVFNRHLFQNTNLLVPNIVSNPSLPATLPNAPGIGTQLPYYSRLLLVAAYLASYNPPRTDQLFFMKTSASKRRKRGGGTALSKGRPGVTKHRKISRKLLGPQAFVLERMTAIFHALREDADATKRGKGVVSGAADIQMGIATLASMRLLIRMGGANGDAMEGGSRWRVAVGWEVVRGVARSLGVEAEEFLAE